MVGATLPFQFGAGAKTVQRPLATSETGFAGAMDEAIGAPAARRDDGPRAATAARSRRPEPTAPRRGDDAEATATARRASSDACKPAADRAEDKPAADEVVAKPDREEPQTSAGDTEATAADERTEPQAAETRETPQASAPKAEIPAEIDGDVIIDDGVEGEGRSVLGETGEEEAEPQAGEGKRPVAAAGEETGADLAKGAGRARGRGWNGASGLPDHEEAHGTARARAEAAAPAGEATGQLVKAAAHAALDETGVAAHAAAAKAAEPAPSAKAAAEDAVAAFAEAGAAVESVAAAENDANADVTDSGVHEREQPRAAAPASRMGDAVASAAGLSDGVRFTATAAAGSAAYASAAPRPEVHVLPQIVQSIKLQTAQGTSEARVQLRPEHLGALNIALKVENGQVTATIHAENAAVRQWIEANEASLRQSLSEQGLQLSKLVVHPDGQQAEQDGREQEPRRQSRRRSWRDEDVTFEVLV